MKTLKSYKHGEAFCVMMYKCNYCHTPEFLWNSRDGVTPFSISCRYCEGTASHINWKMDEPVPNLKPHIGMRIFIDLTEEKHREYMKMRIDKMWDLEIDGFGKHSDLYESKEKLLELLCKELKEGEPDIITVYEYFIK